MSKTGAFFSRNSRGFSRLQTALLTVFLTVATAVNAQQSDDDERAAQKHSDFEKEAEATRSEFNAYRDSVVQDYEKYEATLKEEFDGYVKSISMILD